MFSIKSSSTSVNELIFIGKIQNKPFETSYHICFPLLQWPGINKKMQCSKQPCCSTFLYLQLLVNCDLIQAEIREATDGWWKIRSCFWQTDMNTMQKGGHHPTHCVTVWLFSPGLYEPPVFRRGYAEPQMKCRSPIVVLLELLCCFWWFWKQEHSL